jgi:hypothetical protein
MEGVAGQGGAHDPEALFVPTHHAEKEGVPEMDPRRALTEA